jgi:SNF family Na+-dependent transporter
MLADLFVSMLAGIAIFPAVFTALSQRPARRSCSSPSLRCSRKFLAASC